MRKSPANCIVAGGTWLKMGTRRIGTAIDLSRLGLDKIEEEGGEIKIGAMTSLRKIETSPLLRQTFGGVLSECVRSIVGVQFRNLATIGAGVYSAYGFSDPLCALLALDADIELELRGRVSLRAYLALPQTRGNRDVLKYIYIKNDGTRAAWQSFRQTATDFSVLNLCLARSGENVRLAIGARPNKAMRCPETEAYIMQGDIEMALKSLDSIPMGGNLRGSAGYRHILAQVLLEEALK